MHRLIFKCLPTQQQIDEALKALVEKKRTSEGKAPGKTRESKSSKRKKAALRITNV